MGDLVAHGVLIHDLTLDCHPPDSRWKMWQMISKDGYVIQLFGANERSSPVTSHQGCCRLLRMNAKIMRTIFIFMNQLQDYLLKSLSNQLGQKFFLWNTRIPLRQVTESRVARSPNRTWSES